MVMAYSPTFLCVFFNIITVWFLQNIYMHLLIWEMYLCNDGVQSVIVLKISTWALVSHSSFCNSDALRSVFGIVIMKVRCAALSFDLCCILWHVGSIECGGGGSQDQPTQKPQASVFPTFLTFLCHCKKNIAEVMLMLRVWCKIPVRALPWQGAPCPH